MFDTIEVEGIAVLDPVESSGPERGLFTKRNLNPLTDWAPQVSNFPGPQTPSGTKKDDLLPNRKSPAWSTGLLLMGSVPGRKLNKMSPLHI